MRRLRTPSIARSIVQRSAQRGLTLAEVLVALLISVILMVPITSLLTTALSAKRVYVGSDDIAQQGRFAMDYLTNLIRSSSTLPAKGVTPTQTQMFGGRTISLTSGSLTNSTTPITIIADNVTAFSVNLHTGGTGGAQSFYPPIIDISLTLTSPTGEVLTLNSSTRMAMIGP